MTYLDRINAFWEAAGQDDSLKATHKSLYFALLYLNNLSDWRTTFTAVYHEVMHYAGITNQGTYYKVLEELQKGGYIKFKPGKNRYLPAQFELVLLLRNRRAKARATVEQEQELKQDVEGELKGDVKETLYTDNKTIRQEDLENNNTPTPLPEKIEEQDFSKVDSEVLQEATEHITTIATQPEEKERKSSGQKKEKSAADALMMPWDTETFHDAWTAWKNFRKNQHNFQYKAIESEQAALLNLSKLADGVEETALKIIMQSMEWGWKGLFALKTDITYGKQQSNSKGGRYSADRAISALDHLFDS